MARRDDDPPVPYVEHPLFPLDDGQKPFDVSFIQLSRKEGGAMVFVPQHFRSEELTSTDQILERFGGGTYELYARSQSKSFPGQMGNISKRRLVTLPGRPKPLDPSNATNAEEIAAGIRPNPFDVPKPQGLFGSGAGSDGVLVAILQMNQQAAQAAQQQSQQFMALMMQMMSEGKKEAAESSRMMMQMFTQMTTSQQQSMMQMLPLLVGNRGGGPEEFAKYAELMKSLGFGRPEPAKEGEQTPENESVGAILENVADIVAGAPAALSALKGVMPTADPNGAAGVPQMPTGEMPPPGSAASVAMGRG
jgi:hypothetical protein